MNNEMGSMPIQKALGAILHDQAAIADEINNLRKILIQVTTKSNNDGTVMFALIKTLVDQKIITEDQLNEAFKEQMKTVQEELQKAIKEQEHKPELYVPESKIIVPK